jgi:hypothetical protein
MDQRHAGAGRANSRIAVLTAILVLTATCAAASSGDVASVAFVAVSYV